MTFRAELQEKPAAARGRPATCPGGAGGARHRAARTVRQSARRYSSKSSAACTARCRRRRHRILPVGHSLGGHEHLDQVSGADDRPAVGLARRRPRPTVNRARRAAGRGRDPLRDAGSGSTIYAASSGRPRTTRTSSSSSSRCRQGRRRFDARAAAGTAPPARRTAPGPRRMASRRRLRIVGSK